MKNIPMGGNLILENKEFILKHNLDSSVDISVFSLTVNSKVKGDEGMTFYGAPNSSCGSISLGSDHIKFNLNNLPSDIVKLAVTATVDSGTFSSKNSIELFNQEFICKLDTTGRTEAALILIEFYLHKGSWKVKFVSQGFNGGLEPLAKHFGVEIANEEPVPAHQSNKENEASTINLSKISLTKASPKVNLTKKAGNLGLIKANLNWNVDGLHLSKIDLDLGAFIKLRDGRKSLVQALGNNLAFGNYIRLLADDRSGSSVDGEWIHIYGENLNDVQQIVVFAFIYEGAINWEKANASVTLHVPDMPPIETKLSESDSNSGFCAIAELNIVDNNVSVKRLNKFYKDHQNCDVDMGWGFKWKSGKK